MLQNIIFLLLVQCIQGEVPDWGYGTNSTQIMNTNISENSVIEEILEAKLNPIDSQTGKGIQKTKVKRGSPMIVRVILEKDESAI